MGKIDRIDWNADSVIGDLQTSRIDIVCFDGRASVKVRSLSGSGVVMEPSWIKRMSGTGAVVYATPGRIVLEILCNGSGLGWIYLRGIDKQDDKGARLPFPACYTSCMINGHELLEGAVAATHDKARKCSFCFRADESFRLQIDTAMPEVSQRDLQDLLLGAYPGIAEPLVQAVVRRMNSCRTSQSRTVGHAYNNSLHAPIGKAWNEWRIMDGMPLEIDMACSLGSDCVAASQLKNHGLRTYSLPFDWCMNKGDTSLHAFAKEVTCNFAGFALKQNMRPMANKPFGYEDCATGYGFIHHFKASIEKPGEYEDFREVLNRRIARFYSKIEQSGKVLFLVSRYEAMELSGLRAVLESCKKKWPDKKFYGMIVSYNAAPFELLSFGDIRVLRIARDRNCYDIHGRPFEWSFLDNVVLTSKASC